MDCETNSPYQHLRECIGNSMENIHAYVRVERVKILLASISYRIPVQHLTGLWWKFTWSFYLTSQCTFRSTLFVVCSVPMLFSSLVFDSTKRVLLGKGLYLSLYVIINPLTPMSDQNRIFPHNIHTISSRQGMRTKRNIK